MNEVQNNLEQLQQRIAQATTTCNRDEQSVTLVAVSKTKSADKILQAVQAGQTHFGENYLQEALEKIQALDKPGLTWHFIGPIQSNKTRDIAAHFDWVHSVDRYKIARRLSEQRPDDLPALNLCLQVNISDEDSKSGLQPSAVLGLAQQIAELPNVKLRGLMAIPAPADNEAAQRAPFAKLRKLRDELNINGLALDHLSMGMSDDLEPAIAEGATMVRVGSAIFGARD